MRTLVGLLTSNRALLQLEAARCLHELSHSEQSAVAEACLPATSYLLTYLSGHSSDFIVRPAPFNLALGLEFIYMPLGPASAGRYRKVKGSACTHHLSSLVSFKDRDMPSPSSRPWPGVMSPAQSFRCLLSGAVSVYPGEPDRGERGCEKAAPATGHCSSLGCLYPGECSLVPSLASLPLLLSTFPW